jgi:hypothetical protein
MEVEHCATHPHPRDPAIFEAYQGDDRLACGCASRDLLEGWFGDYLPKLVVQGAHITQYSVPQTAIVEDTPEQILFVHRRARVIERLGHEPPAPLIRSSAGSRMAIIESSDGKYDFAPAGRSRAPR